MDCPHCIFAMQAAPHMRYKCLIGCKISRWLKGMHVALHAGPLRVALTYLSRADVSDGAAVQAQRFGKHRCNGLLPHSKPHAHAMPASQNILDSDPCMSFPAAHLTPPQRRELLHTLRLSHVVVMQPCRMWATMPAGSQNSTLRQPDRLTRRSGGATRSWNSL